MDQTISYALNISFAGISIVFTSLIIISFVVSFMRRLDNKLTEKKEQSNTPEPEKPQTLDNTTLVLIAAAAKAAVRQRNIKIRSVRRIVSRDAHVAGWTMQGRSVLHGSHVLNVKTEK
jgi:Na+-transporting methylmalonyl-CoA/oxaloacetate decarboxylase gamma subunit